MELLKHLNELETEANERLAEIPEEFNKLEDSENYNYYSGVLETIKNIKDFLSGNNKLLQEIKNQVDCVRYLSCTDKICYKTFGNLSWYFLKCNQYGLNPKREGNHYYTAKGDGFEFDYCEHNIIFAIDNEVE